MKSLAEMCRRKNAWEKWCDEWRDAAPERSASRVFLSGIAGFLVGLPVAAMFTGDLRALAAATIFSVWMFSTLWTEHTGTAGFWDKLLLVFSRGGFVVLGAGLCYLAFATLTGRGY